MMAKNSTGEVRPRRASRSRAPHVGRGLVHVGRRRLLALDRVADRLPRDRAAEAPVLGLAGRSRRRVCRSPAAIAQQRSLTSCSCRTPRPARMLSADGQPSASAIEPSGVAILPHALRDREIDSSAPTSSGAPGVFGRAAHGFDHQHGTARRTPSGRRCFSWWKPIPTITGVFGASSAMIASTLTRPCRRACASRRRPSCPRARRCVPKIGLPTSSSLRERVGLAVALVDLAQHAHQRADRERRVVGRRRRRSSSPRRAPGPSARAGRRARSASASRALTCRPVSRISAASV